ncbi:MAG: hypothetical protein ACK5NC_06960 [Vibrio sp.]
MADKENYQMAIDLLSYHLGLSKEEAEQHLGLIDKHNNEDTTYPETSAPQAH